MSQNYNFLILRQKTANVKIRRTVSMNPFFGRQRELEMLRRLLQKSTASLVVIKGRRRIGKSRLAEEFGKSLTTYTFVGLPPEKKVTAQMQRKHFANQMQRMLQIPGLEAASDWSDLFWLKLTKHISSLH